MQESGNKNRSGKIWIASGVLLLAAALLLAAHYIAVEKKADAGMEEIQDAVHEEMAGRMDAGVEDPVTGTTDEKTLEDLLAEREMPTFTVDGNLYVGELLIPAFDMTLPILAEYDYDMLNVAPCRFSGSVYQNDMVLAGHNYKKHFSPVRWLSLGSEIDFVDAEGKKYRYELTSVEILQPDELEALVTRDDWDLTLFTCTMGGRSRYTARCTRIDETEPLSAKAETMGVPETVE